MSNLPLVVITDLIVEPLDCERGVLNGHAHVKALDIRSQDDLNGQLDEADAVMIYHYLRLGRAEIERLKKCRIIARPGVGYDNIDIVAAREKGIAVCNVPDYGTEEVADSAIGMTLTLTRGTHFLNSRLRADPGDWNVNQAAPIHRLRGKTFGIIGCGRIGSAVAMRAKAFGFDIVFYDPLVPDGLDKALGIRRVDTLDELLAQSYVVSLHCPLTSATKNMIGPNEIKKMPPGSYLINTARGGVVHTDSVIEAIHAGHLAGAGIDVLEHEPPSEESLVLKAWRNPEHPAHHRFILNPHTAYYCEEGCVEFRTKAAREILRAFQGKPLRNQVN